MLKNFLTDLLWLVYPNLCAACDRPLNSGENCICTFCRFHLPQTYFHLEKDNIVEKHFWGRIPLVKATSFFHYSKGEKVQRLIHRLKYEGQKEIGIFVGQWIGEVLLGIDGFGKADLITPVPLHPSRQSKRGYNQSAVIAQGMSCTLGVPYSETLRRNIATTTQTKKHRYERYQNVDNVFEVMNSDLLQGKHIVLVDDVITTGSTLIACSEAILKMPQTSISIVTLAYA